MTNEVYVVPCSGQKLTHPAPARDLYQGTAFRYITERVEAEALEAGGQLRILSALHGLVDPAETIAPYDVKMGDPGSCSTDLLMAQLYRLTNGGTEDVTVYSFLPKAYRVALDSAARLLCDLLNDDIVTVQDVYEAAPGIGYQRGVAASLAL